LHSKHIKLAIIRRYASTNEASEEEKEAYYQVLHDVTTKVPKDDILVVIARRHECED